MTVMPSLDKLLDWLMSIWMNCRQLCHNGKTIILQNDLCEFYIYFALDYGQEQSFELISPILE